MTISSALIHDLGLKTYRGRASDGLGRPTFNQNTQNSSGLPSRSLVSEDTDLSTVSANWTIVKRTSVGDETRPFHSVWNVGCCAPWSPILTLSNLGAKVVAQSCLYAILSHRPRLVVVRPVRNRFALLSEISSSGALRD